MKGYIKTTVKLSPNQIMLPCGSNNLPSNVYSKDIVDSIMILAKNTDMMLFML